MIRDKVSGGGRPGANTEAGGRYPQREVPEWPGGFCVGGFCIGQEWALKRFDPEVHRRQQHPFKFTTLIFGFTIRSL